MNDSWKMLLLMTGFFAFFWWVFTKDSKIRQKSADQEAVKLSAMSEADRVEFLVAERWGKKNEHIVCPHCQTKGNVRNKATSAVQTSTSQTGNILKINTTHSVTTRGTQFSCGTCEVTWVS